ncbi:hypothetical protein [Lactiplantibacillus paraxiangfangensis]|uniref:hypothetical protein n=1 Tax=Lactiplantibacillus paraxiangfangensis TaxID=3076224 RepID=UPI0030C7303D
MDYSQKSLTKDGLMMLSGSDADSTSIVIDKMIVSQQSIDKSIDLKYLTLSDFTNPIEFNINSVQKNDDSFQVKAAVSNNATGNILTSDYKVALIGVVAHTSTDSTDKLLGVVVGVDPFILPAYNNVPVSYIAGVTFGYSNATNITIQIKNDVYALSTDVQALDKATVKDNHDGTITANGTTFTPADDTKVMHPADLAMNTLNEASFSVDTNSLGFYDYPRFIARAYYNGAGIAQSGDGYAGVPEMFHLQMFADLKDNGAVMIPKFWTLQLKSVMPDFDTSNFTINRSTDGHWLYLVSNTPEVGAPTIGIQCLNATFKEVA